MTERYRTVSCGFHDVLEDAVVRRRVCLVHYRSDEGDAHQSTTTIGDLLVRDGAEFAQLGTGAVVRLDRLDLVEPVDSRSDRHFGRHA